MKKAYRTPVVKKVEYAFDEQIVAVSIPIRGYADWYNTGIVCTYGLQTLYCNKIYNEPQARGLNNCLIQGDIEGIG